MSDRYDRCLAAVEACNRTLAWRLGEPERRRYAASLAGLVGEADDDEQLRTVAANYHADHAQVEALRSALSPGHEAAWRQSTRQIVGVLRARSLDWSGDGAIDIDDLTQFVTAELARALPDYRYRSRLSSWVYRLTVQSAIRQVRRAQAGKRAVRPEPLDPADEGSAPPDPAQGPELTARARLLAEQVGAILAGQPDRRLRHIFYLAVAEGKGTSEIGALVRLHPSRVRALLAHARQLLREHPAIRAWLDEDERQAGA